MAINLSNTVRVMVKGKDEKTYRVHREFTGETAYADAKDFRDDQRWYATGGVTYCIERGLAI